MIIVLKVSEKQRLNVACHLLLDTDIVLLDQPTEVSIEYYHSENCDD